MNNTNKDTNNTRTNTNTNTADCRITREERAGTRERLHVCVYAHVSVSWCTCLSPHVQKKETSKIEIRAHMCAVERADTRLH